MADFAAVLRKTIGALKENSPDARARVYEKARATIEAKLAAVSPPPPPELAARQKRLLEEAIETVEAEFAAPPQAETPAAEAEPQETWPQETWPEAPQETAQEAPAVEDASEPAAWSREPAPDEEQAGADIPAPAQDEPEPAAAEPEPAAWSYEPLPAQETREAEAPTPQDEEPDLHADAAAPAWPDYETAAGQPEPFSEAAERPAEPAEEETFGADEAATPERRRRGGLVALVLLVLLLGAAAAGGWFYRDDLARLAGHEGFEQMMAQDGDTAAPPEEEEAQETARVEPEAPVREQPQVAAPESTAQSDKFTQRLLPDGREVDPGPAGGEAGPGEGTSIAAATQDGEAAQAEGAQNGQALPVGQKAFFYEERTSASQGSAETGTVVWSIVEESPGNDLPPEPTIQAEARIPEKDLQLKMTIRRNVDQSLPASHIMELIFLTPDDFAEGGVDNVLRVTMKRTEQDTGNPLLGIPAKIADGFFLVALSDSPADVQANTLLMRRQSWIDIPIVYSSGRRALMTLEKGVPGDRIFNEALAAWQRASSG